LQIQLIVNSCKESVYCHMLAKYILLSNNFFKIFLKKEFNIFINQLIRFIEHVIMIINLLCYKKINNKFIKNKCTLNIYVTYNRRIYPLLDFFLIRTKLKASQRVLSIYFGHNALFSNVQWLKYILRMRCGHLSLLTLR